MKKIVSIAIPAIAVVALSVLGFVLGGVHLSKNQADTLLILVIICASSMLYCFVVGEISRNNSQMDKLWSLLPIAYAWVIAGRGGFAPRLVLYAIIATLWGIRLTANFARKGAYRLKFWEGEEDYRWAVLRSNGPLKNRGLWMLFDLFFICIYQNALVLAMCLPALACMDSPEALGAFDYVGASLALCFLMLEAIADEQQMAFHTTKKKLLSEGKTLEELPSPFNLGFNTTGLWNYFRHPNYLGEQGIWAALYLMVIGAGAAKYGIFNWTLFGPAFLILLFMGSAAFGESISASKYLQYKDYQAKVWMYLPLHRFRKDK